MTTPPSDEDLQARADADWDETPTIVRLPLLPSPAEMENLREQRMAIEDTLHRQAKNAAQSVAECAAALDRAGAALDQAVHVARAVGVSWSEVARHVGISRQAAAQRWGA